MQKPLLATPKRQNICRPERSEGSLAFSRDDAEHRFGLPPSFLLFLRGSQTPLYFLFVPSFFTIFFNLSELL